MLAVSPQPPMSIHSGIGDSGDWAPLKTFATPTTAVGSSVVVEANWDPHLGEHKCLHVVIVPEAGELSIENNRTQENVFTFRLLRIQFQNPSLELPVAVRNPLPRQTFV